MMVPTAYPISTRSGDYCTDSNHSMKAFMLNLNRKWHCIKHTWN